MTNKERATLNYLLTKLKIDIEEFIDENGNYMTSNTEEYYDGIIEEINDILIFSLEEGDELDD